MSAPRVPNLAMDEELKRKLLFTLLALVIYRVGAHIAAPGVNVTALADFIRNSAAAGFFGLYDALGGGLSRATVFALGIMPYISASIIFQLAGGVAPSIGKMQKDEEGKKKITQWTRYLTVFISLSQAYTFALFTESIPGAIPTPGFWSRLIMVVTLTTGAIFVMWLGEQITERGIGNGMSLLITFSILERLWPGTLQLLPVHPERRGHVLGAAAFLAILVAAIAAVVAMTIAARRIPIQIPRKVMGRGRIREGQKTFIPIRLITAGVMPIIFAQTIIIVPGTLASFTKNPVLTEIASFFQPGRSAVRPHLRRPDPGLQLLLHVDHLQFGRPGGEPEEAGRVHPRREAGRQHGGLHRRRPGPHHPARRPLPRRRGPACRSWSRSGLAFRIAASAAPRS